MATPVLFISGDGTACRLRTWSDSIRIEWAAHPGGSARRTRSGPINHKLARELLVDRGAMRETPQMDGLRWCCEISVCVTGP